MKQFVRIFAHLWPQKQMQMLKAGQAAMSSVVVMLVKNPYGKREILTQSPARKRKRTPQVQSPLRLSRTTGATDMCEINIPLKSTGWRLLEAILLFLIWNKNRDKTFDELLQLYHICKTKIPSRTCIRDKTSRANQAKSCPLWCSVKKITHALVLFCLSNENDEMFS